MSVGDKIQQIRIEKGYSQELVAEQLGVSRQAISKWENDISSPSTDNLIQLSNFFDIPLDYLLKDKKLANNINNKAILYPSEKVYKKRYKYIRNISNIFSIMFLLISIAYLKDTEIAFGIFILIMSGFYLICGYKAQIKWREVVKEQIISK